MKSSKELREQINKLGTDLKALIDKAGAENRDLTGEEKVQFDKIDKDRNELQADERRALAVESLEAPAERRSGPDQPTETRRVDPARPTLSNEDRAEAMRAWFLAGNPDHVRTPEQIEAARRSGIQLDRKQLNLRLAPVALRSMREEAVSEWAKRYLSVSFISPSNGSNLTVPDEAMRELETALLAFGGMRQVATVVRTNTGADMPWPTLNDTSNEGAILGEGIQTTEQDPTFDSLVFNAFKYTSKKILVSVEFLQDSAVNASEVIGRLLGERIARITNRHFTVGTGSSQPNGITAASTASGTQLAAQTPTNAELVAIEHSVDPAYRNGARWMFHDSMLAEMKKITDASTGRPIWLPGMAVNAPDTILGYPYTINQHMAVAAGSGAAKSIEFGQLSKYVIRDVRDITLVRLDELYAEYGQVAFLAFSRHDGDLLDAGTHPVKHALNKS